MTLTSLPGVTFNNPSWDNHVAGCRVWHLLISKANHAQQGPPVEGLSRGMDPHTSQTLDSLNPPCPSLKEQTQECTSKSRVAGDKERRRGSG